MHLAAEADDLEMLTRLGADLSALPSAIASLPAIKNLKNVIRQLGEARAAGNRQLFMQLINDERQSAAAFLPDEKGMSQLHYAAQDNAMNILGPLLKIASSTGITCDTRSKPASATPLHAAAQNGQLENCRTLIQYGAGLDSVQHDGKTPVHLAAASKHGAVVEELAKAGADVDVLCASGCTALMWAVKHKDEDMCRLLLESCAADPNSWSEAVGSALHQAFKDGSLNLAKLLVAYGATSIKDDARPELLLHLAVRHDDASSSEAAEFISAAAQVLDNMDSKDSSGRTALILAMEKGKRALCELLLEEGASPATAGPKGDSPLHLAARNNDAEMIGMLHGYGADLDPLNDNKNSPLYEALLSRTPPAHAAAEALIQGGAELDFVYGSKGDTLLHQVANAGDNKAVDLLVKGGADTQVTNNQGMSAADMAATVEMSVQLELETGPQPRRVVRVEPGGPDTKVQARKLKQQERQAAVKGLQAAQVERRQHMKQKLQNSVQEQQQQEKDTQGTNAPASDVPNTTGPNGGNHALINGRFVFMRSAERYSGSAGEVVFAVDSANGGQTVAIKLFKSKQQRDHSARILRELPDEQYLATLLPNTDCVFDGPVTNDGPQYALVTAAGGASLAERLSKLLPGDDGRAMGLRHVAAIMDDLLQCVDYMHSKRVVHCDLAPANVVFFDYRYRLVDFERAQRFGDSMTGTTPVICAPEAAKAIVSKQNHKAAPALDVWALGCIMWHMIAGEELVQSLFPDKHQDIGRSELLALLARLDQATVDRAIGRIKQTRNVLKQDAVSLLGKMLVVDDPSCRWTAKDLIKHAFIEGGRADTYDVTRKKLDDINQKLDTVMRQQQVMTMGGTNVAASFFTCKICCCC